MTYKINIFVFIICVFIPLQVRMLVIILWTCLTGKQLGAMAVFKVLTKNNKSYESVILH
jgi:hypothetical protein